MYKLMDLPYQYDALEPYIDAQTMETHYSKHHQGYVTKLNAALEKYPDLQSMTVDDLLKKLNTIEVSDADRVAIKNNGGGVANHNLFWQIMAPTKVIDANLQKAIVDKFGSLEVFKENFTQAAVSQFGSGWAWLVKNERDELEIYSLPNQDSPLTKGHTPLICLDVWEHAYYLKYQNKRPDYIANWWNVLKLI